MLSALEIRFRQSDEQGVTGTYWKGKLLLNRTFAWQLCVASADQ
jgi:hypothetical protein